MKKVLVFCLAVCCILSLFVACDPNSLIRLADTTYKIQPDGTWKMGYKVYEPSTKPYILFVDIEKDFDKGLEEDELAKGLLTLESIRNAEGPVSIGEGSATIELIEAEGPNPEYYNYLNKKDGHVRQNIFMKTSSDFSETILLDAPDDTFSHYDTLNVATVKEVEDNSYHEYGQVRQVTIEVGHAEIEAESNIDVLVFGPNATGTIKTTKIETVVVPDAAFASVSSKISGIPATALTAKASDKVKVGNKAYATIEAAIGAASDGDTVELFGDLTSAIALNISKSVVLDLKGYTLSAPSITVASEKTFEITCSLDKGVVNLDLDLDSPASNSGSIKLSGGFYNFDPTDSANGCDFTSDAVAVVKTGTYYKVISEDQLKYLVKDSVITLVNDVEMGSEDFTFSKSVTVDLNGYTFDVDNLDVTDESTVVFRDSSSGKTGLLDSETPSVASGSELNIESGNYSFDPLKYSKNGSKFVAIKENTSNDTFLIVTEKVNNLNGVLANSKIPEGSTVVLLEDLNLGSDTAFTVSKSIVLDLNGNDVNAKDLEIAEGATLTITDSVGTGTVTVADNEKPVFESSKGVLELEGGNYGFDPSSYTDVFVSQDPSTGLYKVASWSELNTSSVKEGDTLKLAQSINQAGTPVVISKSITLDLNGKTLTASSLNVTSGANVLIVDSEGAGAFDTSSCSVSKGSSLKIEGGSFGFDPSEYAKDSDRFVTITKDGNFFKVTVSDTIDFAKVPENSTITLSKNVDLGAKALEITKSMTLDLNGKTITASSLSVASSADAVILDSVGTGVLNASGCTVSGSLSIKSGSFGFDPSAYIGITSTAAKNTQTGLWEVSKATTLATDGSVFTVTDSNTITALVITQDVTFDLNGQSLGTAVTITVKNNANVVITDSSTAGSGIFTTTTPPVVENGSSLKIVSGSYGFNPASYVDSVYGEVTGSGPYKVTVKQNNLANFDGAFFELTGDAGSKDVPYAISSSVIIDLNGYKISASELNISGTGTKVVVIDSSAYGTGALNVGDTVTVGSGCSLTIKNGNTSFNPASYLDGGSEATTSLVGGYYVVRVKSTSSIEPSTKLAEDSGSTNTEIEVTQNTIIDLNGYTYSASQITIADGANLTIVDSSIAGTGKLSVANTTTPVVLGTGSVLTITNGSISFNPASYVAEGSQATAKLVGDYYIVSVKPSSEIDPSTKLDSNAGSTDKAIAVTQNTIIDLNGYTYSAKQITVASGATLTIVDTSIAGNGKLAVSDTTTPVVVEEGGKLTIVNGNISFDPSDYVAGGSSATSAKVNRFYIVREKSTSSVEKSEKLSKDTGFNTDVLAIKENSTIDLNGYKYSAKQITVADGATLTIVDTSIAGTGKLSVANTTTPVVLGTDSHLIIINGSTSFNPDSYVAEGSQATAELVGGYYVVRVKSASSIEPSTTLAENRGSEDNAITVTQNSIIDLNGYTYSASQIIVDDGFTLTIVDSSVTEKGTLSVTDTTTPVVLGTESNLVIINGNTSFNPTSFLSEESIAKKVGDYYVVKVATIAPVTKVSEDFGNSSLVVSIKQNTTIDLNGYEFNAKQIKVADGATLTIVDTSVAGTGKLSVANTESPVELTGTGKLTIINGNTSFNPASYLDGGSEATTSLVGGYYVVRVKSTSSIEPSTKLAANTGSEDKAITVTQNSIIDLNGYTYSASQITVSNGATLTIVDSSVAGTGKLVVANTVTGNLVIVNGSTSFDPASYLDEESCAVKVGDYYVVRVKSASSIEPSTKLDSNNGSLTENLVIAQNTILDLNGYTYSAKQVTVSNGATLTIVDTSIAANGKLSVADNKTPVVLGTNSALVVVNGSTTFDPASYMAEGSSAVKNGSGNSAYYSVFTAPVVPEVEKSSSMVLLSDTGDKYTDKIVTEDCAIDLMGYTFTAKSLQVKDGAKVTILDTEGTGVFNTSTVSVAPDSSLIIVSGNFKFNPQSYVDSVFGSVSYDSEKGVYKVSTNENGPVVSGNITLNQDLAIDGPIEVSSNVTIDLQGKTLTAESIIVKTKSTLVISDSIGTGTFLVTAKSNKVSVEDGSKLIITGGKYNFNPTEYVDKQTYAVYGNDTVLYKVSDTVTFEIVDKSVSPQAVYTETWPYVKNLNDYLGKAITIGAKKYTFGKMHFNNNSGQAVEYLVLYNDDAVYKLYNSQSPNALWWPQDSYKSNNTALFVDTVGGKLSAFISDEDNRKVLDIVSFSNTYVTRDGCTNAVCNLSFNPIKMYEGFVFDKAECDGTVVTSVSEISENDVVTGVKYSVSAAPSNDKRDGSITLTYIKGSETITKIIPVKQNY